VVALAVAVEAKLGRQAALPHRLIVLCRDVAAEEARPHPGERLLLKAAHRREGVFQFLRGGPEDDSAGNLGVETARSVGFDEEREGVAGRDPPALGVAAEEDRGAPERGGSAENDPLLAADRLAR